MLTPHEFATLLLVKDAPAEIVDRVELEPLIKRQWVALEQHPSGAMCPRLTADGNTLVEAIKRLY